MNEIFIINKPINWTSMDVLRKMRNILQIKKIGHAGTLDPLATGVLLVCTGTMTKKIQEYMDLQKEYIAEVDLTAFSHTDDLEGPFIKVDIKQIPTKEQILKTIKTFIGTIQQIPPKFSAIKIQGKRAYKKARNKEVFTMLPRIITIYDIKLIFYRWPKLTIEVTCEKGTYIRSLARDIGQALHTGGFLSQLTRTAIGHYKIEQTQTLEEVAKRQAQSVRFDKEPKCF